MKNNSQETIEIMEAIKFFKYASFKERKPYLKDLYANGVYNFNGYIIQKELWSWLIWKPTDIGESPQYKGQPLVKVVPDNVPIENIPDVLNAQPWTYI